MAALPAFISWASGKPEYFRTHIQKEAAVKSSGMVKSIATRALPSGFSNWETLASYACGTAFVHLASAALGYETNSIFFGVVALDAMLHTPFFQNNVPPVVQLISSIGAHMLIYQDFSILTNTLTFGALNLLNQKISQFLPEKGRHSLAFFISAPIIHQISRFIGIAPHPLAYASGAFNALHADSAKVQQIVSELIQEMQQGFIELHQYMAQEKA